jgi:MFS transporter, DHA1 family, inner membrane transport protein
VLHRALDESYPEEVRSHITHLTAARLCANACFRFAPAFLATIAAGQHVTLDRLGVALAVGEASGLMTPLVGQFTERFQRRTAMVAGLTGVGIGAGLAGSSTNLVVLAIGLVILAQSKAMFDLGLSAWVSDRVVFERRGRVIGLTETSWALGLLVGVTIMGLVTAATSWRFGYALGAVAVVALAAYVARTLPDDPKGQSHAERRAAAGKVGRRGWVIAVGMFCLMAASQSLFVTFSGWLRDHYGLSDTGVSVVAFGLGFGELFSSLSAARFSDRWGKERATAIGAGIMIPAALLLALGAHSALLVGLPLLVVAIAAFEFAVVSAIPLATEIVPGAPARGLALTLGFGTFGRATCSVVATRLYVHHGMAWPAVMCACFATGMVLAMWRAYTMHPRA